MNITFTGQYVENQNGGISFEALVNNQIITCIISQEALQDINPGMRFGTPEQQFLAETSAFQNIARQKLLSGQVKKKAIYISSPDLIS